MNLQPSVSPTSVMLRGGGTDTWPWAALYSSHQTPFPPQVEGLMDDIDFKAKVTRAEFENLCADLFERVPQPVKDALSTAEMTMVSRRHTTLPLLLVRSFMDARSVAFLQPFPPCVVPVERNRAGYFSGRRHACPQGPGSAPQSC